MEAINYAQLLNEVVLGLRPKDDPGQLAYLALSSKCEHAVRDRMALILRQRYLGKARIARELTFSRPEKQRSKSGFDKLWQSDARGKGGIDLAVLDPAGQDVIATLELKQIYGFDFLEMAKRENHVEVRKARRDVRVQRLAAQVFGVALEKCPVLLLVFDVLPQADAEKQQPMPRVLKYHSGHQKRFKSSDRSWAEDAESILQGSFWNEETGRGNAERLLKAYDCGSAEGFAVTLDAWLLQPC
jgi:hypothetical protein